MSAAQPASAIKREITLRAPGETEALLEVWLASWRATYAEIDFNARVEWFLGHLASLETEGALTLCLRDGDAAALAGFVVVNPNSGWLDQLCVHPDYFGGGVGAALIEAARRAAPQGLRLDVNADNKRALRFYAREGFAAIGPGAPSRSGRATLVLAWKPSTKA